MRAVDRMASMEHHHALRQFVGGVLFAMVCVLVLAWFGGAS